MDILKDKGAVVTGAASGIGRTIVIDGGSLTRGYPRLLTGLQTRSAS